MLSANIMLWILHICISRLSWKRLLGSGQRNIEFEGLVRVSLFEGKSLTFNSKVKPLLSIVSGVIE